ncbi:FHA domain-containing protein [Arenimonas fontis]|uniref:FHA domain-containing protein n=1 Tax=Arenimonas fontis TaxID=2608255 RepID=A0A5B2Z9H1_9GAMM|nr:FHA domain-containing protein [Arenimonas fontis]KAA2284806.1 FHA domain-containing protein [Arenimonas fontis]
MKLVFPNGEHSQVLLSHGVNRIGSAGDVAVLLNDPAIAPLHCEIHVTGTGANLQVPAGGGPVSVNGKPVSDIMALRPGDQIGFAHVIARFAVVEAARPASAGADTGHPDEDTGATRVRTAVPKFVLRGVSGAVFGKVFPVTGPLVIGRAVEADISVPAEEISRRHALVKPTPDGLSVEDLGSSNGTYINNRRVQQGFLGPGDELRLDAVRFILVAPGMEMAQRTARLITPSGPAEPAPAPASAISKWVPIMLTLAAIAVIVALVLSRG